MGYCVGRRCRTVRKGEWGGECESVRVWEWVGSHLVSWEIFKLRWYIHTQAQSAQIDPLKIDRRTVPKGNIKIIQVYDSQDENNLIIHAKN